MLGDELKKSLEPIKTSDDLLEKTRRAIAEARIQQAAASMESNTSRSSAKRSSRNSLFLKAAVPVLCALLLVGGMVLVIPKLSKDNKTEKTKNKSRSNANVNAEVGQAYDNIEYEDTVSGDRDMIEAADAIDGNAGKQLGPDTTAESEPNGNADQTVAQETTVSEDCGADEPADDVDLSEKVSYEMSVEAGEYIVSIGNNGHALYVDDASSEPIDHKDDKSKNAILSDFSGTILDNGSGTPYTLVGLLYEEETSILYMTVRITEEGKGTQYFIMYGVFENGSLDQSTIKVEELHG